MDKTAELLQARNYLLSYLHTLSGMVI